MTVRVHRLRRDQIAETLRRHGVPEDANVLGVRYDHDDNRAAKGTRVLVMVEGVGKLVVPDDVLEMEAPPSEAERRWRTLFERPGA